MELPHLQIICTQLFEALPEGETTVTLASYEQMGKAERVLGGYLNAVLGRLPGKGANIAKEVLKELVSSEATRRVLSYNTLAARIEAERDEMDDVLDRLVDARLLSRDEVAGEIIYEMAHEYLIDEIRRWIDREDLEWKRAQELLEREVANWRLYDTLIPRERLEVLHTHRERFECLDAETRLLLLRSALKNAFAVVDWVGLAGAAGIDLLIAALQNESGDLRSQAVAALARMRSERAAEPLLRAAADPDAEVAGLAVQGLVELGEAARSLVAGALAGTDPPLWLGALRYLVTRSDDPLCREIPWERMLGLPLVWIPLGSFWMGSDDDPVASGWKTPRHQVTLPGYWIGRYPVTVAQFRTFVQDSGYKLDREAGLRDPDDYPMRYVTWHDAMAYCRWLSARSGLPVTLPSEAQWEKAARGTDGRRYPWGNEPPTAELCNFDRIVGHPTPVGRYSSRGDSPYGCADMAGNVWEWTLSLWGEYPRKPDFKYPYDPKDGRENQEAGDEVLRVLRGGTFLINERLVRCACRDWYFPVYGFHDVGFRVVVAPG